MADRLKLQSLLEELLGSKNVYYRAPESGKMSYPAIKYSKQTIKKDCANDKAYSMKDCYQLIVIAKLPDHPVIKKLLALPYCSYDRYYVSDNLNHDVLTLYY